MRVADPIPQFSYVVQQIAERHPNFAFVHVVEPRVQGATDVEVPAGEVCRLPRAKVFLNSFEWRFFPSQTTSSVRSGSLGP